MYTNKPETLSIGIAGAGLLGRLLAWQLSLQDHRVQLFDQRARGHDASAAHTAAGMLAPLSEAAASHPSLLPAGLQAIEQWRLWCEQLGISDAFHAAGSLILAHPQDVAELRQFTAHCQRLGDAGEIGFKQLNRQTIATLEPDLSENFTQGLWAESEAHLDNRQVLAKLDQRLENSGATLTYQHAVRPSAGQILDADNQRHTFDLVIDCRGAGARQQLGQLRGVRGETLHLQTREVRLQRPVRLLHPRYQLYIVPKPEHRFVIGATQLESEDLSPISLQSSLELASAVYTLAPAFAEARILEAGVNLRPAYTDNLPKVTSEAGLITANGLYRHGYLLAPLVVNQVLSIVRGKNNRACEQLLSPPKPSHTKPTPAYDF